MAMNNHYIYKITFLCGKLTGCYYIGKRTTDKNIEDDNYFGSGVIPKSYYKKYPPIIGETIQKEILEICSSKDELADKEKVWINDLYFTDDKCVNQKAGGEGGSVPGLLKGRKMSEDHRKHLSESQKGKKHSEETKQKMSESHKGKKKNPLSKEAKLKISESLKGYKHSDKAKQHMSESQKGKKHSEETKQKMSESHKGQNNSMYGKKHSEETRQKMSEAAKRRAKQN